MFLTSFLLGLYPQNPREKGGAYSNDCSFPGIVLLAFSLYTVSRVESFSPDIITHVCKNENDNVAKVFVKAAEDSVKNIYEKFKNPAKMIFDEKERVLHDSQNRCYACSGSSDNERIEKRKVRDHCHLTGKYRGALHSKCNLKLRKSVTFPVIFHNLTGYDSHLFVRDLADSCGNVDVIPHNEQKYMTFTKKVLVDEKEIEKNGGKKIKKIYWKLKFLGSLNFMKSSLERLVGNLDRSQLNHMKKHFQGKKLDLMCSKGVYPYEYMTDVTKLRETNLPPKEAFASKLNVGTTNVSGELIAEDISDEKYKIVQEVYKEFKCKNLADLTKVYVEQDTLQLADIVDNFRNICLENYGLDLFHYISLPSLAIDGMLKITKVELELLLERDMYLFFEKGIRGGISVNTRRYAKANNPYMGKIRGKTPIEIMQGLKKITNEERWL